MFGIPRHTTLQVRNLVDARTLWELGVFPADVLAPDEFKRPSKDLVHAARDVRAKRRRETGRVSFCLPDAVPRIASRPQLLDVGAALNGA